MVCCLDVSKVQKKEGESEKCYKYYDLNILNINKEIGICFDRFYFFVEKWMSF